MTSHTDTTTRVPSRRTARALAVLGVAAGAALAGCTDDDTPDEAPLETIDERDAGQAPGISADLSDGSGEGGNRSDGGSESPTGSVAP